MSGDWCGAVCLLLHLPLLPTVFSVMSVIARSRVSLALLGTSVLLHVSFRHVNCPMPASAEIVSGGFGVQGVGRTQVCSKCGSGIGA